MAEVRVDKYLWAMRIRGRLQERTNHYEWCPTQTEPHVQNRR